MTAQRRKRGRPPKDPQPEVAEESAPEVAADEEKKRVAPVAVPASSGVLRVAKGALCTMGGVLTVGDAVELKDLSRDPEQARVMVASLIAKGNLSRG